MKTPAVLLTGASSQIGVFAIPRLLDAGFQIFAVNRKGKPEGIPDFEKVEWLDESGALEAVKNCQYLLSAGPMELAQKYLQVQGRIQRVVAFSSSSIDTKHNSPNTAERLQVKQLQELEARLRSDCKERKLTIFRPTLIYGCGLDTNISRLASWIRKFGFMPVNGKAAGLRQPVHADDLAAVAVAAMLCKDDLPVVLNLAGGETLSYSEMVSRVFRALRRPVRLLRLPQWLFVFLVRVSNAFKAGKGINTEMVKRQPLDLVFDDREARQLLNYKPRLFSPQARDFSLPDFENKT